MPTPAPSRSMCLVLGGAILAFSSLWLQWTHEAGHVIAGLLTGADLDRVVLDTRTISRTDFAANPRPLITVWGGPVLGCLMGAGLPWLATRRARTPRPASALIVAIVLIGNGAYIGLGPFLAVGDTETLQNLGTPAWAMVCFGIACVLPARLMVLGSIRDMGEHPPRIRTIITLAALSAALAAAGLVWFPA